MLKDRWDQSHNLSLCQCLHCMQWPTLRLLNPRQYTWHCSTKYTEIQADVGSIYLLDISGISVLFALGEGTHSKPFRVAPHCWFLPAIITSPTPPERPTCLNRPPSAFLKWYCTMILCRLPVIHTNASVSSPSTRSRPWPPPPSFPRASKSHSPAR